MVGGGWCVPTPVLDELAALIGVAAALEGTGGTVPALGGYEDIEVDGPDTLAASRRNWRISVASLATTYCSNCGVAVLMSTSNRMRICSGGVGRPSCWMAWPYTSVPCEGLVDLSMTGYGLLLSGCRIEVDIVLGTSPVQNASCPREFTNELPALHKAISFTVCDHRVGAGVLSATGER